MAMQTFRIVSETYINGKCAKVGEIVTVSEADAALLKEANRVEAYVPESKEEAKKKQSHD